MKIQENLGRFESHFFTMAKLMQNMLDAGMTKEQITNIAKYALEEAIEVKKQEESR